MKRSALLALSIGAALFIALLAWHGIGTLAESLEAAGWGLLALAAFHLLPLLIDAAGLHVLCQSDGPGAATPTFMETLGARWAGESVNSLLPAGQMGGPLVMARLLTRRHGDLSSAGAVVTVATTQQMLGQIVFALLGVALLAQHAASTRLLMLLLAGVAVFAAGAAVFYRLQRRGLFGRLVGLLGPIGSIGSSAQVPGAARGANRAALAQGAARLDTGVVALYRRRGVVRASFLLHLLGWVVGVGEVWLALRFLGFPVGWGSALLLESLGQAIRGMAFAVPGALGIQEGGYLLLAPLVGLSPDTALALSLCKRARELLLGIPGLLFWSWTERSRLRRPRAAAAID